MSTKEFIQQLFDQHQKASRAFPDKELAEQFIDQLFAFLFLPNKKQKQVSDLEKELALLRSHFSSLVYDVVHKEDEAEANTEEYFKALPYLYAKLIKDAEGILKFDPAARSLEEVLVAYPGFYA